MYIVLDPFAGCGTFLVSAQRLKRQWIGIDISPTAVGLMKRRMEKVGARAIKLVNMPTSADQLRELKPFESQNWVIQRFNGTHSAKKSGDLGIDGLSFFHHWPIQVKQSEHVGRNVVDNFEAAMERTGKDKGYIVAFSFTKGAYEEAARVRGTRKLDIELVTLAKLVEKVPDLAPTDTGRLIEEDLLLPSPRPAEVRPSVEELVESETAG